MYEIISYTQNPQNIVHVTRQASIVLYPNFINTTVVYPVQLPAKTGLREDDTFTLSGSGLQSITLRKLSNQRFVLKRPIEIKVEAEQNGYIFSNDDLNVYTFGEFCKETLDEWERVLIDSYRFFHATSDDQLTTGTKILKEQLEAIIEEQ